MVKLMEAAVAAGLDFCWTKNGVFRAGRFEVVVTPEGCYRINAHTYEVEQIYYYDAETVVNYILKNLF